MLSVLGYFVAYAASVMIGMQGMSYPTLEQRPLACIGRCNVRHKREREVIKWRLSEVYQFLNELESRRMTM
jgi:hypothetical protein